MSPLRIALALLAVAASFLPGQSLPGQSLPVQERTDRVVLAVKWTKDEVTRQKMVMQQSQEMTGAQSMKMDQVMEMTVRCEVIDVTDSGTATIRLCHEALRQTVRNGDVEIVYDSSLDEQSPSAVQSGLSALGSILNRPFTLDVDSSGKVVKLHQDVAEFRESVLEGLGGSPATAVIRPLLEQMLSDNTLRQSVEATYQMLPQTAVTLGVGYNRDINAPNPLGKTTIHATVTPAREGNRDRVTLDFDGSLDATIDNANPALAQIDMKFIGGTISGRTVFDLVRGQMDRGSNTVTIHMEMRTKGADPLSEPILRQFVKTTMTMETLSVERKQ